ncbi:bacteriocin resistance YdeI/OmpD-like protein [Ulvibacter sp. MAR_2010_11]|uniref:YdeI/OmpD-associated family protein n=1 Tax=Ulvibacter sp. MAR_2010_11 TaxID=1250229 RepID=UPI000C2B9F96|nr:YdeI/OmpD-associated family protein [Ulvibacter sp. MAR_2010_11]PKA83876.1 bacteriocin resistance YdeI/OmpD-like protein [Ulvibacter sp. MAR_2010_11]
MNLLTSDRFEVTLVGTHGLIIPEAVADFFVEKGHTRVQLKAFFKDAQISFHGALHKYEGNYMVSFGKRYQKELGVFANDYFELQLIENTTKYGVEMPEELSAVLESDPEASELFDRFTDGKKRSLIYYILRFKNSQTRIDKALLISENIKRGITDQQELVKQP